MIPPRGPVEAVAAKAPFGGLISREIASTPPRRPIGSRGWKVERTTAGCSCSLLLLLLLLLLLTRLLHHGPRCNSCLPPNQKVKRLLFFLSRVRPRRKATTRFTLLFIIRVLALCWLINSFFFFFFCALVLLIVIHPAIPSSSSRPTLTSKTHHGHRNRDPSRQPPVPHHQYGRPRRRRRLAF